MAVKRNSKLRNTQSRLKQTRARGRSNGSGSHVGRYFILFGLLGVLAWVAGKPLLDRIVSLPVFTIRTVQVEGTQHLDKARILKSAAIHPGENIFRADLAKASRLLRKEFAAQDFTLFRRLPDTIVIRVVEREPVALINDGELVGVDAQGVLLPHIGADMVDSLPIITGVTGARTLNEPGAKERLMAGLRLLDAITRQAPGVQKRISEINAANASTLGISLLDNGIEVVIGDGGWAGKLPNLEKVIRQVVSRGDSVQSVDMRFGEKIFIRKAPPVKPAVKAEPSEESLELEREQVQELVQEKKKKERVTVAESKPPARKRAPKDERDIPE